MELIEGQGLDQVLTADGLPAGEGFRHGIAIADALAAAHDKGIVHRDLKPANVMLTRGRAREGARLRARQGRRESRVGPDGHTVAPITTEGAVIGTVPYMSPEQLRGQPVDHRSDIFSLGVLLYEMATGRRPFSGATNTDVMSAILRDTPRPLAQMNPELPHQLGRIIAQCLEKDPEERYHSAKDVRNALRGLRKEVESGAGEIGGHGSAIAPPSSGAGTRTSLRRKGLWVGIVAATRGCRGRGVLVRGPQGRASRTAAVRSPRTPSRSCPSST